MLPSGTREEQESGQMMNKMSRRSCMSSVVVGAVSVVLSGGRRKMEVSYGFSGSCPSIITAVVLVTLG